ncbi:MAG: hypothetical protein H6834_11380 [Planctomycetes bacterium]|nr:hypothetical protein [Planctomycetota bacterium]
MLWATDLTAQVVVPDGAPSVVVTSNRVGQTIEVQITNARDGDVRVELRLDAPTGSSRALAPLTGTIRNGRLTLHGPVLGEDDRWHALQVRVIDAHGKAVGSNSVSIR